jgi:ribosomal protein S18 acetylase RimI-like enzyme
MDPASTGGLTIREAGEADAEAIARVVNAAFEIEREFREGDRTSPADVRNLMEREAFLVAVDAGRVVGAVEVRQDGATGYFGMLAVDETVRRGGIGRALVAAAEERCRRAGCTRMTMSTGEDRTELIPYYQKQGYRLTAIEPSASAEFKHPIRVVKMEKPL